ncbi:MAG: hypothetical protein MJ252_12645 [archaeon]|nr:hypothetical protein [archaeon]
MKNIFILLFISLVCLINSEIPNSIKNSEKERISRHANNLSSLISQIKQDKDVKGSKLEEAIEKEILIKIKRNNSLSKEERKKLKQIMDKYNDKIEEVNEKIKNYIRGLLNIEEIEKNKRPNFISDFYNLLFEHTKTILYKGKGIPQQKKEEKKEVKPPQKKEQKPQQKKVEQPKQNPEEKILKQKVNEMASQVKITEKKPSNIILDFIPKFFTIIIFADSVDTSYLMTLRSIQLQNFQHIQIIFLVNKRNKHIIRRIEQESKKDYRIRKEEVDISIYDIRSKVRAIRKAVGKYIMIIDKNYIFAKNDALIKLHNILKNQDIDLVHFMTFEGNILKNQLNVNKQKFIHTPKIITQPELQNYLLNKFKKPFLGDKILNKDIFKKESQFDKLKGYNCHEFIKLYSKLAKKYMTYDQGVLYEFKPNYIRIPKPNKPQNMTQNIKKEVPKPQQKDIKKEVPKPQQKDIKKEVPKPQNKTQNIKKEAPKPQPKLTLDQLINETILIYKKFLKDPKFSKEYNSMMVQIVTKENILRMKNLMDVKTIRKYSEFCMDNLYTSGLTVQNANGLKEFCERVFDAQVKYL